MLQLYTKKRYPNINIIFQVLDQIEFIDFFSEIWKFGGHFILRIKKDAYRKRSHPIWYPYTSTSTVQLHRHELNDYKIKLENLVTETDDKEESNF